MTGYKEYLTYSLRSCVNAVLQMFFINCEAIWMRMQAFFILNSLLRKNTAVVGAGNEFWIYVLVWRLLPLPLKLMGQLENLSCLPWGLSIPKLLPSSIQLPVLLSPGPGALRLQGFVLELVTSQPYAFFLFISVAGVNVRNVFQESKQHIGSVCLDLLFASKLSYWILLIVYRSILWWWVEACCMWPVSHCC